MSKPAMQIGWASVSEIGPHGCLAMATATFDSCKPTQDAALADVEEQLVEALRDVRALRAAVAK